MVGPHQDNGVPYSNPNATTVPGTTYGYAGMGTPTPPVDNTNTVTNTQNNQGGSNLGVSIHTDQPYTPPVVQQTYDLTDFFQDLATTERTNPKYDKSYAYGPDGDGSGMPLGGKFYAQDSSGRPIYDSSGNLVLTGTGGMLYNQLQDAGIAGSNQNILSADTLKAFADQLTFEDLTDVYDQYYRNYTAPGGEGGYTRYGFGPSERDRKLDLLRFLNRGAPIRGLSEQGFFDSMKDAYSEDLAKASDEGIFSGILKAGVFDSEALKRLIRSYGSGVAKPRYTNVARGGIISLLGA